MEGERLAIWAADTTSSWGQLPMEESPGGLGVIILL